MVLGLCSKFLIEEGHSGGFCEKLLEASPVSDGASASLLQDRAAAAQGQAHQQWYSLSLTTRLRSGVGKASAVEIAAEERMRM